MVEANPWDDVENKKKKQEQCICMSMLLTNVERLSNITNTSVSF